MRVAMLSPLYESVPPRLYGGTERVIANLCEGLRSRGIEVTLFASGDSTQPGVELVPVIDEALRLRPQPVADPNAYHFKMLSQVAARAHEFDLIHNHHDYWMLPLGGLVDTPMLTTLHGKLSGPDAAAAYSGFADAALVSISDSQRAPLPGLRYLKTIHHGIDPARFEFHGQPGKYLAFLGRISAEKRPEWAIALARASGIPLKIAAKIEGKESQAYYDALVRPHVDGKFIEFVGEISEGEKSDFLGGACALAFPIDWPEPFGLVVIEALACGTPVLCRPCGAMPEITRDGVTGFMAEDLATLARHAERIGEIDRRGCRRWVEDRFSQQRMTEDYIDAYERLIQGPRGRIDRDRWDLVYPIERVAYRNP
jgi:glycosyltransferase involved in cell wall biosynthesis